MILLSIPMRIRWLIRVAAPRPLRLRCSNTSMASPPSGTYALMIVMRIAGWMKKRLAVLMLRMRILVRALLITGSDLMTPTPDALRRPRVLAG